MVALGFIVVSVSAGVSRGERIVLETINGTTIYPYQSLFLKVWVFDPENQVVYAGGDCNVTIWTSTDLVGFYRYPGVHVPMTLSIQFNSTGHYTVDIYCRFPDLNTTYHRRIGVDVVYPPIRVESDIDWGIWIGYIYLKVPYDLNGFHGVARIGPNYYRLYWRNGVAKIYMLFETTKPITIDLYLFGRRTILVAYPRIHPPVIVLEKRVSRYIRYDNTTNTYIVSPSSIIAFRIEEEKDFYPHPYPVVTGTCKHTEMYNEVVFFPPDIGEECTGIIVFKWWNGNTTNYTVRLVTPEPIVHVNVSGYDIHRHGVLVGVNVSAPYILTYRLNVTVRTMNGSITNTSIVYSGNETFVIIFDRQPPTALVHVTVSTITGRVLYDQLFTVKVPRYETPIPPPISGEGFCDERNIHIPDFVASRLINLGEKLILYEYCPGNMTNLPSILVTVLKPYHPLMYVDRSGNLVFKNLPPGAHIVLEWGTGYIERLVTKCTEKLTMTAPISPDLRVMVIINGIKVIDSKPFQYQWTTVTVNGEESTIPGTSVSVKETKNGIIYINTIHHAKKEQKPLVTYIDGETIIEYIPGGIIILDNGEVKVIPPSGVLVINDIVNIVEYYPPQRNG